MTYTERRHDLLTLAEKLAKQRVEILETISQINQAVGALVAASDAMLPASADELEQRGPVRKVSYKDTTTTATDLAEVTNTTQRACSICGRPGHRKTTCPEANKDFKQKRDAAAETSSVKKRACSVCRQTGHRATTCPRRKK